MGQMDYKQSLRIHLGNETKNVVASGFRNADHRVGIDDAAPFAPPKSDLLSSREETRQDLVNHVCHERHPRASPAKGLPVVGGVPDDPLRAAEKEPDVDGLETRYQIFKETVVGKDSFDRQVVEGDA